MKIDNIVSTLYIIIIILSSIFSFILAKFLQYRLFHKKICKIINNVKLNKSQKIIQIMNAILFRDN